MGGDDPRLSGADESFQSGTAFPEGGSALQNSVLYHILDASGAAIRKEDSGAISYCEHPNLNRRFLVCAVRLVRAMSAAACDEIIS